MCAINVLIDSKNGLSMNISGSTGPVRDVHGVRSKLMDTSS